MDADLNETGGATATVEQRGNRGSGREPRTDAFVGSENPYKVKAYRRAAARIRTFAESFD
jgi:hypothetical protein